MVRLSTLSMTLKGGSADENTSDEEDADPRRYRSPVLSRLSSREPNWPRGHRGMEYANDSLSRTHQSLPTRIRRSSKVWRFLQAKQAMDERLRARRLQGRGADDRLASRRDERDPDEAIGVDTQQDQDIYAQVDLQRKHRRRREKRTALDATLAGRYRRKDTNIVVAENGFTTSVPSPRPGTRLGKQRPVRPSRPDPADDGHFQPRLKSSVERSLTKDGEWLDRKEYERLQMYLQVFRSKETHPTSQEFEQTNPLRKNRHETKPANHRIPKNKVSPDPIEYSSAMEAQQYHPPDIPPQLIPPLPAAREESVLEKSSRDKKMTETAADNDTDDETCHDGLLSFLEKSSLPALRVFGATSPGPLKRLLWFLALAAGIGIIVLVCVNQARKLLASHTTSSINYEVVRALAYPAITICNNNMIRKSFIKGETGLSATTLDHVLSFMEGRKPSSNSSLNTPFTDDRLLELIQKGSHQLDDMFLSCKLGGASVNCDKIFTKTLTAMGVCFTINAEEYVKKSGAMSAERGGIQNGLIVTVNLEKEEYAGLSSVGVKVLVSDTYSVPMVQQYGTTFPPGNDVLISIKKQERNDLPNGNCEDTRGDGYSNPLKHFRNYSQSACVTECRVNRTAERCRCKQFFNPGDHTICQSDEKMTCLKNELESFSENDCPCRRKCNSIHFNTHWSSAIFPGPGLIGSLASQLNKTKTEIREDLLRLTFYYEDLTVRKVTERTVYDPYDLIGDLSGLLCFFIGLSFATFIEFLELLFISCYRGCCCRRKRRTNGMNSGIDA